MLIINLLAMDSDSHEDSLVCDFIYFPYDTSKFARIISISTMQKIITGIKSTGSSLHLGNLMGAVLPFQKLAAGNDAAIFVADLHSLTSVKD